MSAAYGSVLTISCHILVAMTIDRTYVITNPYKGKPKRSSALIIASIIAVITTIIYSVQLGIIRGIVEYGNNKFNAGDMIDDDSTKNMTLFPEMSQNNNSNRLTFGRIDEVYSTVIPNMSLINDYNKFKFVNTTDADNNIHGTLFLNMSLNTNTEILPISDTIKSRKLCVFLPKHQTYYQIIYIQSDLITWGVLAPLTVLICNLIIIVYTTRKPEILNTPTQTTQDKRVTRLLLTISLFFLFCILPSTIYSFVGPFVYEDVSSIVDKENPAFRAVTTILLLNHSGNFLLYIMSGSKLREEAKLVFRNLLMCGKWSPRN